MPLNNKQGWKSCVCRRGSGWGGGRLRVNRLRVSDNCDMIIAVFLKLEPLTKTELGRAVLWQNWNIIYFHVVSDTTRGKPHWITIMANNLNHKELLLNRQDWLKVVDLHYRTHIHWCDTHTRMQTLHNTHTHTRTRAHTHAHACMHAACTRMHAHITRTSAGWNNLRTRWG